MHFEALTTINTTSHTAWLLVPLLVSHALLPSAPPHPPQLPPILQVRWMLGVYLSLVPRPPPFLPSICVYNNTQERMIGEKWGRPGNIRHMSGRMVDIGGRGRCSNMYALNLKASFFTCKKNSLVCPHWSPKTAGEALEWMIQCIVLAVGPLSPYVHLVSTHMMNAPRSSPFFTGPLFPCVIVNANRQWKWEGLWTRLGASGNPPYFSLPGSLLHYHTSNIQLQ